MKKHNFYSKTPREQFKIQLFIAFGALIIIFLSLLFSWKTEIYFIGILIVPITLSLIAPFIDTPSLKKSGKLKYHSLLFLSEKPKNGVIRIHGGTLFDYFFVLDKKMTGTERVSFILQQYLQGLLNLLETYEKDSVENFKVQGTSYIVNERTLTKLGFGIVKTDIVQKIILTYNYFNLLGMYSLSKNKLSFPNLSNTKTFEANLDELMKRKELIENLNEKLKIGLAYTSNNQPTNLNNL